MDRNKKNTRERWSDSAFMSANASLASSLVSGSVVISNTDMAGVIIGKTGPVQDFWNINLFRAQLEDVDLSYSDFACSLSEAHFNRVSFYNSEFDRCLMRHTKITNCDFSNAKLVVNLDDAVCDNCKFIGATFASGKSGAEYGGRRVQFIYCDFSKVTFKNVEFRATQFIDCVFEGANFISCDLRGVKVHGSMQVFDFQFEKMDIPIWAVKAK